MNRVRPLANFELIALAAPVKLSRRILILFLLATGFSVVQGLIKGLPDPSAKTDPWGLSLEAVLEMDPLLWVDARSERLYEVAHFPGALHLNHDNLDSGLSRLLESWEPETSIVIYCDGDGCESSRALAAELREMLGDERIYWLIGGWEVLRQEVSQ